MFLFVNLNVTQFHVDVTFCQSCQCHSIIELWDVRLWASACVSLP